MRKCNIINKNNMNQMNSSFSLLSLLPYHIKDDISWYIWRMHMNSFNTYFHKCFSDLMSDGRLWIKYDCLADKDDTRYQRLGGMVAFNFRILDYQSDNQYIRSISRVAENDQALFKLINHDIFLIKDNYIIKECIYWTLPTNY